MIMNSASINRRNFLKGTYTITVDEGKSKKTIKAVQSLGPDKAKTMEIIF